MVKTKKKFRKIIEKFKVKTKDRNPELQELKELMWSFLNKTKDVISYKIDYDYQNDESGETRYELTIHDENRDYNILSIDTYLDINVYKNFSVTYHNKEGHLCRERLYSFEDLEKVIKSLK